MTFPPQMSDQYIESLQKYIQSITEQNNNITQDSTVTEITQFDRLINDFDNHLQYGILQKQLKPIINAIENAGIFAEIIRCLLIQDYKNIIISTFKLIGTLSFTKSNTPQLLSDNGSMALLAYQLENKNGSMFVQLTQSIQPLIENHTQIINKCIIRSLLSQLTNLQEQVRQLVYQQIQLLLIKQTPYFHIIYSTIIQNSVTPDLYEDIVFVVNLLSCFYQEPQYKKQLIGDNQIANLLTMFIPKEEIIEQQQQNKEKKVTYEKPDIIYQKMEETKQKIQLLDLTIKNFLSQIQNMVNTQILKKADLEQIKQLVNDHKEQLNQSQLTLNNNQNLNENELQKYIQDFQMKQSQFQQTEQNYNQIQNESTNLQKKIELKQQDCKLYEQQKVEIEIELQQLNESYIEAKQGRMKKYQEKQEEKFQVNKQQHTKKNYEYRVTKGAKCTSWVEYIKDFFSCMMKNIDCMTYLCEHNLGISFIITSLADQQMCPQMFAFYDLLANILFCNMSFRNEYYRLLINKTLDDHLDKEVNDWFGHGQYSLIQTYRCQYDENQDINDTERYLMAEKTKINKFRSEIVTSFNGNGLGGNSVLWYLCFCLQKMLICSLVDFLKLQLLINDIQSQQISKLFMGELMLRLELLLPHQYVQIETNMLKPLCAKQYPCNLIMCNKLKGYGSDKYCRVMQDLVYELQTLKNNAIQHNKELTSYYIIKPPIKFDPHQYFIYQESSLIIQFAEPLRWNWERINDILQMQKDNIGFDLNEPGLTLAKKMIQFLDGSLKLYKSQQTYSITHNLYLSPYDGQKANNQEVMTIILSEPHMYCNLFQLQKCDQSVRIAMICFDFLTQLNKTHEGFLLIKNSNIASFFLEIFNDVVLNHPTPKPKNLKELVCNFICVLSYTHEGFELLMQKKVVDALTPVLYDPKMQHFVKLFTHQLPLSTQYVDKTKATVCMCGGKCLVSNQYDDALTILCNTPMSSFDVTTRYCCTYHFGILLKQRKYLLNKYRPGVCKCLCRGCCQTNIHFYEIINQKAEKFVLQQLVCLVNDVQPEIGILALTILEEFIDPSDTELIQQINVKNYPQTSVFLKAKCLQNEEVAGKITESQFKTMHDITKIYQWQHNIEYRSFLASNRYLTRKLKDVMYDKAVKDCDTNTVDDYLKNIDHYALDQIVVPHITGVGRASLGLKPDLKDIDQRLQLVFNQDKSNENCSLPQTLTNTQFYPRPSRLISISYTVNGCNLIIQNQVLQQLEKKLLQTQDRMRISYRGVMNLFSNLMTQKTMYEQYKNNHQIFKLFHSLAIYCDIGKTKQQACYSIIKMSRYQPLKQFYEKLGWNFYSYQNRDRIIKSFVMSDNVLFELQHKHLDIEETKLRAILIGEAEYCKTTETKSQLFNIQNNISMQMHQFFQTEQIPASDRENYFQSKLTNVQYEFPDLQQYKHTFQAIDNNYVVRGVLSLQSNEYEDIIQHYNYTQDQQQFINDHVYQEKAKDYVFALQKINKNIPESHVQFNVFKQKENYKDLDLAIYEACEYLLSKDQMERISGHNLIQQAKQQKFKISALLSVFVLYFLANVDIKCETRQLLYQICTLDAQTINVLNALVDCSENIEKHGFM